MNHTGSEDFSKEMSSNNFSETKIKAAAAIKSGVVIKIIVFLAMAAAVYIYTPVTHQPVKFEPVADGTGLTVTGQKVYVYGSMDDGAKVLRTYSFGDKVPADREIEDWYKLKMGRGKYGYLRKSGILAYDLTKKHVALTFDDGPSRKTTPVVLKALGYNNCRATFFVVGAMINKDTKNIIKQEVSQGCEIGNHSYSHPFLPHLGKKKVGNQISKTDDKVQQSVGILPKLCRAPYGGISHMVLDVMKRPNISWSVDTLDWKTRSGRKTFKTVRKRVRDGDIVLMHDIHKATAKIVDKICKFLKKKDFETVTVTELASIQGKKLLPGKNYNYFRKSKD